MRSQRYRRQLSVWRNNRQLLTNEAPLRPIKQIIHNRLLWFGNNPYKVVVKDQIGSVARLPPPSSSPGWYKYLRFTRGERLFLVHTNWSRIGCSGIGRNGFLFDYLCRFFYLSVESLHCLKQKQLQATF